MDYIEQDLKSTIKYIIPKYINKQTIDLSNNTIVN